MTNQEQQDYKIAAEKLLNSMGKMMGLKYYGYDGEYTIKNINVYDDGFVELEVTTDKPVPDIMDVKIEPEFKYGKYASASDLIGNLESQLDIWVIIKCLYLLQIMNHYIVEEVVLKVMNSKKTLKDLYIYVMGQSLKNLQALLILYIQMVLLPLTSRITYHR